ncbi:hypothetical protein [Novosphingobium sp.]|uniref:hypothetical protein n=1 Tax=Novosphingobium sp. TaxID=1874826 RepID=UPI003B52B133
MPKRVLLGKPPWNAPIRCLEMLWLETAYLYEELNETVMADTDWDQFAKALQERKSEWSPYFRKCLPVPDYNVGTTASGIDWGKDIPLLVANSLKAMKGDYSSLPTRHYICPLV